MFGNTARSLKKGASESSFESGVLWHLETLGQLNVSLRSLPNSVPGSWNVLSRVPQASFSDWSSRIFFDCTQKKLRLIWTPKRWVVSYIIKTFFLFGHNSHPLGDLSPGAKRQQTAVSGSSGRPHPGDAVAVAGDSQPRFTDPGAVWADLWGEMVGEKMSRCRFRCALFGWYLKCDWVVMFIFLYSNWFDICTFAASQDESCNLVLYTLRGFWCHLQHCNALNLWLYKLYICFVRCRCWGFENVMGSI